MKVDTLGEHAIWLMLNRKTATHEAFIERMSALIVEAVDATTIRRVPSKRAETRESFLLEYVTGRGKWGFFKSLLKKYEVKEGTARKWISDAGMTAWKKNLIE